MSGLRKPRLDQHPILSRQSRLGALSTVQYNIHESKMSDPSKKSIPAWQKETNTNTDNKTSPQNVESSATPSHAELLEQARDFLNEESIRSAPRERKIAFLREKGLNLEDIQRLLDIKPDNEPENTEEFKTVHDTTASSTNTQVSPTSPQAPVPQDAPSTTVQSPPRDVPPIITYPEFLMKPQKPPPLVTFERLANAAYAFAAVSALAYGASKYIVEPMLESLSIARHELADTTLQELEKFNTKLESSVSHVPYIASKAALIKSKQNHNPDEDTESIDSDPTELFHRDIATQTTPNLSRSSSLVDLTKTRPTTTPTTRQYNKLQYLHNQLSSLLPSINPSAHAPHMARGEKNLSTSITQFQAVLDKLENTFNPFRADYSNIYAPAYSLPSTSDLKKSNSRADSNEAAKFKAEIRNLKGAFLSSRNFPTARPPTATAWSYSRVRDRSMATMDT